MRSVVCFLCMLAILSGCSGFFSKEKLGELPDKGKSFRVNVISYLDDLIRKDPTDVSLYLEKAKYYEQEGWPVDALTDLNEAVKLDSTIVLSYELRQDYYLKHDRYKDVLKDLAQIKKYKQLSQYQLNNHWTALYRLKQYDEFYNSIVKYGLEYLNPLNRNLLGEYYLNERDTSMAVRHFYSNFIGKELDGDGLLRLSNLLMALNYNERAMHVLVSAEVDDPEFNLVKSKLLLSNGQLEEGLELLKYTAQSKNVTALLTLNDYFKEIYQFDSAIFYTDRYLKIDSAKQVLKLQARNYQGRYFWSKAQQYYELVIKKDSNDQEALQELGIVKGKIAYLRNLKRKKDTVPASVNLKPKKLDF